MAPVRFLFVDDDEQILRAVGRLLAREGFEIHTTSDPGRALSIVEEKAIEVVVCDYTMPVMSGTLLLRSLQHVKPNIVRVLASGSHERTAADDQCVQHFIDKPWFPEELRKSLHDIAATVLRARAQQPA